MGFRIRMNTKILTQKRHFICGILLGGLAVAIEASLYIFHDYFLWHVTVPNAWGLLNLPVMFAALVTGLPDSPAVGVILIFLQWFLIGFVCSLIINLIIAKIHAWAVR